MESVGKGVCGYGGSIVSGKIVRKRFWKRCQVHEVQGWIAMISSGQPVKEYIDLCCETCSSPTGKSESTFGVKALASKFVIISFGPAQGEDSKAENTVVRAPKGSSGAGDGFEVTNLAMDVFALIGFPEAASYEFTTLTCIPGIIHYKILKYNFLIFLGFIEGASEGKGRGRQVIAVAKIIRYCVDGLGCIQKRRASANLNEGVGSCWLTSKQKTASGNRKYMKCTYVYNKIDVIGIDDVDRLARQPHSIVISCNLKLNLDRLLARMWEEMGLVRIYSKPQGQQPDFTEPVVLSAEKEDGGRGFKSHSNAPARISDREKMAPLKT
ncbi:UNVERIFIED_CONTAM: Developmentally-regulated G-protein 2 [Sesamum calycinum]|uniref:Developmentally-regulated G-protein 2 n=1 Tax=Sesamum calycinum TaxID=2727403 RepID=A0AAW2NH41_9LAMI